MNVMLNEVIVFSTAYCCIILNSVNYIGSLLYMQTKNIIMAVLLPLASLLVLVATRTLWSYNEAFKGSRLGIYEV